MKLKLLRDRDWKKFQIKKEKYKEIARFEMLESEAKVEKL
jgi:hypothetical protein